MTFRAIYITKNDNASSIELATLSDNALDNNELAIGNVVIDIHHSTLNYKDALAITGKAPVVRRWPMVAGIDGAGIVVESSDPRWTVGTKVIMNGWGAGETHWGCLSEKARVDGNWLVALPESFDTEQAMAIGTAGYTAMLSCLAIEQAGVTPGDGDVLVTGASGGVGSIAVSILHTWGYSVVASTGKLDESNYLRSLGAADIIDRRELSEPGKPLQKERWAAVIDSVGSHTLANACAQTRYGGAVTACGLAQGMDLHTTVAPFILRGVRLLGIDSVMCPTPLRQQAWDRLASDLDGNKLAQITRTVGMTSVVDEAHALIAGKLKGRTVVDVRRD
ncbi:MDR family oxidoreductase [Burkholderia anthina]|uniref:acrylyl-CoA reductase (NADPH) n=1 Tax=Burkholderia anthina TaxID=179879 RepID=UPI000754FA5E|nr:MDR family oxidoreductase [Burkholderia anthina]KVN53139.1 NADPH:quinone dehydrogenase [Burkholderia anthina]